jgi:hypothetical protein
VVDAQQQKEEVVVAVVVVDSRLDDKSLGDIAEELAEDNKPADDMTVEVEGEAGHMPEEVAVLTAVVEEVLADRIHSVVAEVVVGREQHMTEDDAGMDLGMVAD